MDDFWLFSVLSGIAVWLFRQHNDSQERRELIESGEADKAVEHARSHNEVVKSTRWPLVVAMIGAGGAAGGAIIFGGGNPLPRGQGPQDATNPPDQPTISVVPLDTAVNLSSSQFSGDAGDTHESSDWWIVKESTQDTVWSDFTSDSLESWVGAGASVPLETDTSYIAYVVHNAGGGGASSTSAPDTFVTTVAAPDTPTVDAVVFASTADSLRLTGTTFSGDGVDTHDSTAFQVDTAGGDFSSPQYHNVVLGPVTTDTVAAVDSGAVVVSRMRYKGDMGGWSAWSDSLSTTMVTGVPIFSDGFESGDFSHEENDWGWNAILGTEWSVTTDKPRTGTYSAKLVMTSGKTGENFLDVHAQGLDTLKQAWVEYYLWIPSDYYHLDSGTSNNNKFFQGWSGKRSGDKTYMNFETLRETDGDSGGWWFGIPGGDCTGSEHTGGGTFAIDDNHRGTWVHFQWYMENGTTDGDCSDSGLSVGHVKGWINGTLFSELTDLHFVYDTSTDPPGDAKDGVDRFRIFGAQNSGGASQDGEAIFYLDGFKIYDSDPGW